MNNPGKRGQDDSDSSETAEFFTSTLLDAALDEQRRDWLKGKRVSAADRLRATPALASNPAWAAELIYDELLLRLKFGETPRWENYLEQFPQYAGQLRVLRQTDLLIGETLESPGPKGADFGDYEILEEIGRGGMGVVYRAVQRNLGRIVAVKMLRNGEFSDSKELARFMKEAMAVARLNHPNIVHIYNVGEASESPFISFEYVDGPSLAKRIDGTPLTPRLGASFVATVARAIQYAHDHQIVHRDVKPANVLLGGSPDNVIAKVTDFGASKRIDEGTSLEATQIIGTPSYMAPEQLDHKWGMVSNRTDVYGLGAVLYECLTGRAPFRADSVGETLRQVVEKEPVAPRALNPAAPRDIETICMKCLSKNPAERYGSAEELAADLTRFLNGEPILARRPGPVRVAGLWCRRNPAFAALGLSLVIGIAGIAYQWRVAVEARKAAVASEAESLQLVNDLIQVDSIVMTMGTYRDVPRIDSLRIAAAHCNELLARQSANLELRVALTKIRGHLGTLLITDGRIDDAVTQYRSATDLWEPLARAPGSSSVSRDWLATVYTWSWCTKSHGEAVRLLLKADAIWQDLADKQPSNLDFVEKLEQVRYELINLLSVKSAVGEMLRPLKEEKAALTAAARDDSLGKVPRKRLALVCLLLGEAYKVMGSTHQACSNWREALKYCDTLHNEGCDEIPLNALTVFICTRLIQREGLHPYYREALKWCETNERRLSRLIGENRENVWVNEAILENRCLQIACLSKAGESVLAERICRDGIRTITQRLDTQFLEPRNGFRIVHSLERSATWLREANARSAALLIARHAADLTVHFASQTSRDTAYLGAIATMSLSNSSLLNQLGDFKLSLQQAEIARDSYEVILHSQPNNVRHALHLSSVWSRIAKARWGLDQRDRAIEAFEKSIAIQREVFDRDSRDGNLRKAISRSYEKLIYWTGKKGDWQVAAAAIAEREKLWREDREELMAVSNAFRDLAGLMAAAPYPLSDKAQAARRFYLSEGQRVRREAEALAPANEHPDNLTATGGPPRPAG